jgi:hypothetical protein
LENPTQNKAMRMTFFLACVCVVFLPFCGATTLRRFNVDELVSHSRQIIIGHCIASESHWNSKGTLIMTYSQFVVNQQLKGNGSSQLTVVTVGGHVGDYHQVIVGMPQFIPGQESLLFLESSSSGHNQVVGLAQGIFSIRTNLQTGKREAIQSLRGLNLLAADGTVDSQHIDAAHMPLDFLVRKIQILVSSK